MTLDDLCENIRNTVFEILRRRYPETMPTKIGWRKIDIRDGRFCSIVFHCPDKKKVVGIVQWWLNSERQVTICSVAQPKLIAWTEVDELIDIAVRECRYDDHNTIANEFGLGVER